MQTGGDAKRPAAWNERVAPAPLGIGASPSLAEVCALSILRSPVLTRVEGSPPSVARQCPASTPQVHLSLEETFRTMVLRRIQRQYGGVISPRSRAFLMLVSVTLLGLGVIEIAPDDNVGGGVNATSAIIDVPTSSTYSIDIRLSIGAPEALPLVLLSVMLLFLALQAYHHVAVSHTAESKSLPPSRSVPATDRWSKKSSIRQSTSSSLPSLPSSRCS